LASGDYFYLSEMSSSMSIHPLPLSLGKETHHVSRILYLVQPPQMPLPAGLFQIRSVFEDLLIFHACLEIISAAMEVQK
jgi:hypothetical protein